MIDEVISNNEFGKKVREIGGYLSICLLLLPFSIGTRSEVTL
jgi:hypothetical protein